MKNIFLIIFSFLTFSLFAQSGVNTQNVNPNAAFQVDAPSNNKGVIIPRLTKAQRDAIPTTNAEDGLTVYNIDEGCINYWSKLETEWKSVCGKLGKAVLTFDCVNDVTVNGTYIQQVETNSSNSLSIKVNVTKPGEYVIIGSSGNGYSFHQTGNFLNVGTYTVQVPAQGIPQKVGTDNLSFTINGVAVQCKGIKTVTVLSSAGVYSMSCGSGVSRGVYKVGVPLTTDNFIELPINVTAVGSWSISSNTVDGISFIGAGTFANIGPTVVKLYGVGTPTTTTVKNMTLTSNSSGSVSTSCSVNVTVVIPKKRVLAIGLNNGYGYTFGPGTSSYKLVSTASNFGTLPTSIVKFDGFSEIIQGGDQLTIQSQLATYLLGPNPVDIVISAYDTFYTADMANTVAQYLAKGGVFIAYTDIPANSYSSMALLQGVLSNSSITTIGSGTGGASYKFTNESNVLTNGPFGDVTGLYWGEDASTTASIPSSTVVPNIDVLSRDPNGNVVIFKHTKFNFVWIGDGGFNSGDASTGAGATACPFKLDANNLPTFRANYGQLNYPWAQPAGTLPNQRNVYNAVFTANVLAWAVQQAELNGINKK